MDARTFISSGGFNYEPLRATILEIAFLRFYGQNMLHRAYNDTPPELLRDIKEFIDNVDEEEGKLNRTYLQHVNKRILRFPPCSYQ